MSLLTVLYNLEQCQANSLIITNCLWFNLGLNLNDNRIDFSPPLYYNYTIHMFVCKRKNGGLIFMNRDLNNNYLS
jgi:hypothetical protein